MLPVVDSADDKRVFMGYSINEFSAESNALGLIHVAAEYTTPGTPWIFSREGRGCLASPHKSLLCFTRLESA